jgi:hypothetical protein
MLQTFEIPFNDHIFHTLTDSIRIKSRSRQCTPELAAQMIAARAALLTTESPPEDWVLWFADSRYEYVPQGDKRLSIRSIEARPVCGGKLCEEGWEPYKLNGHRRLRRCPDCVKLWKDGGYSPD